MNYKELLERYKNGQLNEEEKLLLEQEIEKHVALEMYIDSAIDEPFFEGVASFSDENPTEETKRLKKSVNKRLRKVVISAVLIVIALYIGVFHVLSYIVDQSYYNPKATTQAEVKTHSKSDFYYDMKAYVGLNIPGYVSNSFTSEQAKGFSQYELSYTLRDLFSKNEQRYFTNIEKGRITYIIDGIKNEQFFYQIWEGFNKIKYHFPKENTDNRELVDDDIIRRKNQTTMDYLNQLNPLSYISMSIVFKDDLSMEQLVKMQEQHADLSFKWVGVRTVEPGYNWSQTQPMHLVGFNPNLNDDSSSNFQPDISKYPLFYLLDYLDNEQLAKLGNVDKMAQSYAMHFKSRLKYLSEREDFVRIFDYNQYKIDFYKNALNYIDIHGVNTYGVLVYGTAEDFLKSIDAIAYDSLYINHVLPTKPNVYYD